MKINILLIAILITTKSYSQESDVKLFVNHLALSVIDVDRSAEFYSNVLMLPEITNRTRIEGIRWFVLQDGRELHLISVIKTKVIINKAIHLGLSTNNFDKFLKRISDQRIPYSDWPGKPNTVNLRADGIKQIFFQDPDGYWVEVNSVNDSDTHVEQTKNEVWQMEENYWKYVKQKDTEAYLTLWDENFIGYPSNNIIGNKAHITDWLTDLYKDKSGVYNYQLTRKVENVFGDIVIALYDVSQTWTNGKNEIVKTSNVKITHTWKKTGDHWLIIGGMGANK
ncbi:MAG: DUF4440 domain-containing protein [Ferruginibacter sp.]